jgi:hypothetical protein
MFSARCTARGQSDIARHGDTFSSDAMAMNQTIFCGCLSRSGSCAACIDHVS